MSHEFLFSQQKRNRHDVTAIKKILGQFLSELYHCHTFSFYFHRTIYFAIIKTRIFSNYVAWHFGIF